jgi:2-polyprenyl-3-methyl-5-hydroxy-6-metoxy-1,4-benzoquinol methylase
LGDQVSTDQVVELGYPGVLEIDFPDEYPTAQAACEDLIAVSSEADLKPLSRRSPALENNNWPGYLRCSIARVVHALAAVRRQGATSGRILDVGSYFGNFAMTFARAGYHVEALDAYRAYRPAFDRVCARLSEYGVHILDFEEVGYRLDGLAEATYDVVLCMSVVEHVPHTPRAFLEGIDRILRPGGLLVLETPNLAYLYNRQKLARGESVMAPIADQYYTDEVYEGHHREYTVDEVVWLCGQIGHELRSVETFNYSYYGVDRLTGRDVENFWAMVQEPSLREIVMAVSRKTKMGSAIVAQGTKVDDQRDWRERIVDPEAVWQGRIPDAYRGIMGNVDIRSELLFAVRRSQHLMNEITRLQGEVNLRDKLLQDLQTTANDLQARLHGATRKRWFDIP